MSDLELRLLDPAVDLPLYREAYNWRSGHRRVLPDRMSFESFTDPHALAIGLFNGELQAVYFLHEVEPRVFQAHFTSQRGTNWNTLLEGAAEVAYQVLTNGAEEIEAWVTPRNRPLRTFLESLGFTEHQATLFNNRLFIKYILSAV